jgi:hypothetical protein
MNSKMKTWEWIALIIATIILDIVQVLLVFIAIGVILNRIIDIVVGILLPLYFWLRGVNMGDWKKIATVFGGFALEEVGLGGDDGLPFWTLEVIVVWLFVIAEKKAADSAILGGAMNVALNSGKGPANRMVGGKMMRQPPVIQKPMNQGGVRLPNGGI